MTIILQLQDELAHRLKEEAARRGQSVEVYLTRLAEDSLSTSQTLVAAGADWETTWRAWAASHAPLPRTANDDRESIYAGRGA